MIIKNQNLLKMAKFEDYVDNSTLTWSDLNDSTNNKVDRYEKLYRAYEEALKAEDEKTATKYEAQLETLDNEILAMVKKQDTPKDEPKAEPTPEPQVDAKVEAKVEENPQPKAEDKPEQKEEVKSESDNNDDGWDFGLLKW